MQLLVMGVFQGLWRFSRLPSIAFALPAVLVVVSPPVRAEPPTLAGTWTASPLAVSWQLGDWGSACGPAPSGGGEAGGSVTVTQSGNELTFSGAGRSFTTGECWERYPGILRISHSASARSFQNVCKTAAGDPRQAKLVTTISATDDRIHFDETGQYQFVIQGQNCTASVRRTRSYALVQRAGEAPPATPSAAPAAPSAPAPPKAARDCENPGLPERLEVRPSRKLMRPGESFEFRTTVFDANGCMLPVTPTWQVISGGSLLTVTAPGRVSANPSAGESKALLEVTLGDRSVRVDVEIASKDRYDALLEAQGLSDSGESKEAAVLRVASESMGAREVVARDRAPSQSRWIVGLAGASALFLGVLGLWLVRRSRARADVPMPDELPSTPRASAAPVTKACPTCREEFPPEAEFCPNDGNRLVAQNGLGVGPGGSVCPVCGRGFNPGTSVCPDHGEELVPAAAFVARRAHAVVVTRTICPLCGKQYGGEIRFCGECGASVVPIN